MASTSTTTDIARLFADLVRCETRLYNALGDDLKAAHGIVTSQFEFLRSIRDRENTRVADLAAEFAIGVGATSKGVDRMVDRGWVERRAHPTDRRSAVLGLTAEGRRLVDAAEVTFDARLTALLADVEKQDLAAAARVLATLRASLEQRGLGIPVG